MTDETDVSAPPSPDKGETPDGLGVRVVDKRWWARSSNAPNSETRSSKPTYVEELERQLADKDGLLTSYAAKYKQASAEFEESRLRLRREIAKDVEREKRRILATFLDIIDNLDRAVDAAHEASADRALLDGVEMVRQQCLGTLEGHGVSRVDAIGRTFDPTEHDAVSMTAVEDPAQHDVVVNIVRVGYRVDDEVLRVASVVVGKHDPRKKEAE